MEELEFIQNERLKLQEKYLKEAKNIWIEFDGEEADKKHKKLYNEYLVFLAVCGIILCVSHEGGAGYADR